MDEKFIKQLLSHIKCRVCGQHYEPSQVKVLRHGKGVWFLSVFCPSCQTQGLVVVTMREEKAISELSEAEISKFAASSPIRAEDVLEMHEFLKDFKGDFSSLFPEKGD